MALISGTKLGPYRIVSKLGEGGMGEVYRAQDPRLGREVAIKVLPDHLAETQEALDSFRKESRIIASLSHPNIREIFDIGLDSNQKYAVMELLDGRTVAERLHDKVFEWPEAVQILLSVADALNAAHTKGIIHRDLKPHNIFLTDSGFTKVLDFGLAKRKAESPFVQNEETATIHDAEPPEGLVGTLQYISPEQLRSQPADGRSDIFALGCVLYEMLTGINPFARETAAETVVAILTSAPPKLSEFGAYVPEPLEDLIFRCLDKDPNRRYASMAELRSGLKAVLADPHPPTVKSREASIAVLPFLNMSADPDNAYFSDGLTEELINALFKVGGLRIASRTSSFAFKGKSIDIRQIGRSLNVDTILEGSVRRSGSRIRITAQLIDVGSGHHLWSEVYDRDIEDIFSIQDEISGQIASSLHGILDKAAPVPEIQAPTQDVEAFDIFLQGKHEFYRFSRRGMEKARELFKKAVDLDPEYASAQAWLAISTSFLHTWFGIDESLLSESDAASHKALEIDPGLSEAHVARAMVLSSRKKYSSAVNEFETAIQNKPDIFEEYYFYARLCFTLRQYHRAATLAERAGQLRPEDYNAPYLLGMILTNLGRDPEAEAAYRMSLERIKKHIRSHPDDTRALYVGAAAFVRVGDENSARKWVDKIIASKDDEPFVLFALVCDLALLGDTDRALDYLEQLVERGRFERAWVMNDPDLDSLRELPRFKELVERMKDLDHH